MGAGVTIPGHTVAVRVAAAELGLADPTLVRHNVSSLWRAGEVALRVAARDERTPTIVRLLRTLAAHGVPVAELLRPEPLEVDGLEILVMRWIDDRPPVDPEALGRTTRRLHDAVVGDELASVTAGLPDRLALARRRIQQRLDLLEGSGRVPDEVRSVLADAGRHWSDAAVAEAARLPTVLVHGDLHLGNVLAGPDGPVLIDWELAGSGPWLWDHAPLLLHEQRFGADPDIYSRFAAGYGADGRDHPGSDAIVRLRALSITLGSFRRAVLDLGAWDEAWARYGYWTSGDPAAAPTWRAY